PPSPPEQKAAQRQSEPQTAAARELVAPDRRATTAGRFTFVFVAVAVAVAFTFTPGVNTKPTQTAQIAVAGVVSEALAAFVARFAGAIASISVATRRAGPAATGSTVARVGLFFDALVGQALETGSAVVVVPAALPTGLCFCVARVGMAHLLLFQSARAHAIARTGRRQDTLATAARRLAQRALVGIGAGVSLFAVTATSAG